jgi:hypothetical protein
MDSLIIYAGMRLRRYPMTYPNWAWFPRKDPPPEWVLTFVEAFAGEQEQIDSRAQKGLTSDELVGVLRSRLVDLGWEVEAGKQAHQKIHRPVLFGDNGLVRVKQEIDGWHPELRIVMELESGRGWMGNAVYRDLVRASLVADARYLVIGVRQFYQYGKKDISRNDFEATRDLLDSIFASGRLKLPFEGVLIVGW